MSGAGGVFIVMQLKLRLPTRASVAWSLLSMGDQTKDLHCGRLTKETVVGGPVKSGCNERNQRLPLLFQAVLGNWRRI